MGPQPLWINKDTWDKPPAPMLVFEGRVGEGRVYDFMADEGIVPPEGMRLKRPSWYFVKPELDGKGREVAFHQTSKDDHTGRWITIACFVLEGANRSLNFSGTAAGAQDEAEEHENSDLPF